MKTTYRPIPWGLCVAVSFFLPGVLPEAAPAMDLGEAVALAKQYLQCTDEEQKAGLSKKLAEYDGDLSDVVEALRPRPTRAVEPGYHQKEHFTLPHLRMKHPDDLLYFVVPTGYRPERPTGLVVFMHGGGSGSLRTAPDRYMTPADANTPPSSTRLGDLFEAIGMIGVGPSAPWNENDHSRWCLPEADDYLADVVEECKGRFHVDADRVFLMGHSMGGFGAYHQVQRQPDRFAAVVASAGSWTLAQWPVVRGTTLSIVHGTKDAEHGVRARHTDVAFARFAHRLLDDRGIPHVFIEHSGSHSFGYGKPHVLEFFRSHGELRRDPFSPRVVLASPVGYGSSKCYPVRHNRWVTLDAAIDGPLEYDALASNGRGHLEDCPVDEWGQWELSHKRVTRPGALIDAVNQGDNRLAVTTTNVARLTLWLHPKMVDFARPIRITLDGRPSFDGLVTPCLSTLLDSFERRRDWGLVYPAKVTLEAGERAEESP